MAKKKEIQRRIGKPVVTDGYEDVSALSLAIPELLACDKSDMDCPGVAGQSHQDAGACFPIVLLCVRPLDLLLGG